MFIQTDADNNIIQLITIGTKPAQNGYEISNDTSIDILKNIFNYKYINNEFVINEVENEHILQKVKNKKIMILNKMCNKVITNGIDFNGEHYSLKECDQINLSKLENLAKEGQKILYHPDGNKCRVYEPQEFLQLTALAFAFISYNTTYFNLLKSEVEKMSFLEEILSVNYGDELSEENKNILSLASMGISFSIPEILDTTDYNEIINSNSNIEELIQEANKYRELQESNNETFNEEEDIENFGEENYEG